jgi:hypothetical protein
MVGMGKIVLMLQVNCWAQCEKDIESAKTELSHRDTPISLFLGRRFD